MDESGSCFYGVRVECGAPSGPAGDEGGGVFDSFAAVLDLLKRQPSARFKPFDSREAARRFAHSASSTGSTGGGGGGAEAASESPTSPFSSVATQSMTRLKKAIEAGDGAALRALVDDNPRFLVNVDNDWPTIVYRGCYYNALHVAAKAGKFDAAEYILRLIGDPSGSFLRRLLGVDDDQSERRERLLDRYLNTPDTGFNETPLHFAAKGGHTRLVALLVGYPQCQRQPLNKQGKTPAEMVCDRASGLSKAEVAAAKEEILSCLAGGRSEFFVPLYRPHDYSGEARVLPPTSGRPDVVLADLPTEARSPAVAAQLRLAAVAGPFDSEAAALTLHARWSDPRLERDVRRSDLHKGLERIGRRLATDAAVDWTEWWPFLEDYADLRSTAGLGKLERFLLSKAGDQHSLAESPKNVGRDADVFSPDETSPWLPRLAARRRARQRDAADRLPKRRLFDDHSPDENSPPDVSFSDCTADRSETSLLCDKLNGLHLNDGGEEEEEEEEVFRTPPSTPPTAVYLAGARPSKLDADAFVALADCTPDAAWPRTRAWWHTMRLYSNGDRSRWPSLESPRSDLVFR